MKHKSNVLLLLLVLVPLALLGWLGSRVARHEQEDLYRRFEEILAGKLRDTQRTITAVIEEQERELLRFKDIPSDDPGALRRLVRIHPFIQQIFVLDAKGRRVHPPPGGPLSASERQFLERTQHLWKQDVVSQLCGAPGETPLEIPPADVVPMSPAYQEHTPGKTGPISGSNDTEPGHGWHVWYWEQNTRFIFWRRGDSGEILGVEMDPVRLRSEIIAKLPDTNPADLNLHSSRVRLVDSNGALLYQWGGYEAPDKQAASATLALSPPLHSWKLEYLVPASEMDSLLNRAVWFNLFLGLLGVGIALLAFAVLLYREYSHDVSEARQRVTFVNQVSHELKTPLTNIRMYAELLQNHLAEEDRKSSNYLDVIVSESHRLSRLIANILSFGKKQKGKLQLRLSPGSVDDVIRWVLEQFKLALKSKGIHITATCEADAQVQIDSDALQQILGNLVSNVEKYAASGGILEIASRQNGDTTTIKVADRGPGIPANHRDKIFQPFYRISDSISDGVAGTGIGLSLARDLARLHGGDLILASAPSGSCFHLTLRTARVEPNESSRR